MRYPLRYPLSWFLARIGITITITINFIYDDEEKVFVATSRDLRGLVLEAENFNTLIKEIEEAIPNLLSLGYKKSLPKVSTDVIYKDHIAIA
jgi:predicted RNase H-like HicB family nuclease